MLSRLKSENSYQYANFSNRQQVVNRKNSSSLLPIGSCFLKLSMALDTIPPNKKEFLNIKVVQESMDAHAKRMGIAFAEWIQETNWGEKETWGRHDPPSYPTTEQLYDIFIQSINA